MVVIRQEQTRKHLIMFLLMVKEFIDLVMLGLLIAVEFRVMMERLHLDLQLYLSMVSQYAVLVIVYLVALQWQKAVLMFSLDKL
jgi:hypothetical protein